MDFDWTQFMALLESENSHFKRYKKSSLDSLISKLKGRATFSADEKKQIRELMACIPYAKQQKYAQTLGNVNTQLGLGIAAFPFAVPSNPTMAFTKFEIYTGRYTGHNGHGQSKQIFLIPGHEGNTLPCSFVHVHKLTWESSNGNAASLASIRTREYVKFDKSPQLSPFNAIQDPDQEFRHPGPPHDERCMGTKGGTSGVDGHSTKLPSIIAAFPRVAGMLLGEQLYEYSCDDGATWDTMEGSQFLLEKEVFPDGGDWIFSFTKRNWAPHNTKGFYFKVEYIIGAPPEYMPGTIHDVIVDNAMGYTAEIDKYARSVVYTGT